MLLERKERKKKKRKKDETSGQEIINTDKRNLIN